MSEAIETTTAEEQAKFYLQQSIGLIGYKDTVDEGLGNAPDGDTPNGDFDTFIRNLEISFHEGVSRMMQNKREIGSHPVNAFKSAVKTEWPEWVKVGIAESEYQIFGGRSRDPDFVTEEEDEYLTFLEDEYDVPR